MVETSAGLVINLGVPLPSQQHPTLASRIGYIGMEIGPLFMIASMVSMLALGWHLGVALLNPPAGAAPPEIAGWAYLLALPGFLNIGLALWRFRPANADQTRQARALAALHPDMMKSFQAAAASPGGIRVADVQLLEALAKLVPAVKRLEAGQSFHGIEPASRPGKE
jgi:hypothetical protein